MKQQYLEQTDVRLGMLLFYTTTLYVIYSKGKWIYCW